MSTLAGFRDALAALEGSDPVRLTPEILDLAGLGTALRTDFGLDGIDLAHPRFSLQSAPLEIHGELGSGPLPGARLTLTADEAADHVRTRVVLEAPENLKLSPLARQCGVQAAAILDALVLRNSTLVAEYDGASDPRPVAITATAVPDGPLALLEPFVSEAGVQLSGELQQSPAGARLALRANVRIPGQVSLIQVERASFWLRLAPAASCIEGSFVIEAGTAILPVRIECAVPIGEKAPEFLLLEGRFEGATPDTLVALAGRLGFADVASALPAQALPPVALDSLAVCLRRADGLPRSVSFGLRTREAWTLSPGGFEVPADAHATVSLDFVDASTPRLSVSCIGTCTVANIPLPVLFNSTLPELSGAARGDFDFKPLITKWVPEAEQIELPHIRELRYRVTAAPSAGVYLRAALKPGFTLRVGAAQVRLADAWIELAVHAGPQPSAAAELFGAITIGEALMSVRARVGATIAAEARVKYLRLDALARELLGESGLPIPSIEILFAQASFDSSGSFSLLARLDLEWTALLHDLGVSLPAGVPKFALTGLTVERKPQGAWRVVLDGQGFRAGGALGALWLETASLTFRGGEGHTVVEVAFDLCGYARPAEGIALDDIRISAAWSSAGNWSARGGARLAIFGTSCDLGATVNNTQRLVLRTLKPLALLDFGPAVRLDATELRFFCQRPADADATGSMGVAGDLQLTIDGLLNVAGTLSVEREQDTLQVALSFHGAHGALTLPIGMEKAPRLVLDVPSLEAHVSRQSGRFECSFTADASLSIDNVPNLLSRFVPAQTLSGHIKLDSHGVELKFTVPALLNPPPIDLRWGEHSLGELQFRFDQVAVRALSAADGQPGDMRLDLDMSLTVPEGLNALLKKEIFNDAFAFTLSLARRPQLSLVSSPLHGLALERDEKDPTRTWWNLDLTPYAAFKVMTPVLSFEDGQWSGGGGFTRHGPVRMPLAPLKFALTRLGVPRVIADGLPQSVQLHELDLDSPAFRDQLQALFSEDLLGRLDAAVAQFVREAIDVIYEGIERLPEDFREYLRFKIPVSLTGSFLAGTTGQLGIELSTAPDEPLKLLLPTTTPFGPGLLGITLSRLGVSEVAAGTLLLIDIDGHVDLFDLPMLAGALVVKGRTLRNRFALENVLAVAPTEAPVVLPLFYDRIGYELLSVTGLEVCTEFAFRRPSPSILGLLAIFDRLFHFFTEADYLLHEPGHELPPEMRLNFVVGRNFLRLPNYLGGASLGIDSPLPPLSIDKCIAYLLDSAKKTTLAYLIRAIPLSQDIDGVRHWYRIGSVDVEFGPVHASAAWCITTEEEYKAEILTNTAACEMLARSHLADALDSLPKSAAGAALDRGFVVLLMTSLGVTDLGELSVQFGIAVTAGGGFETGLRVRFGDPNGLHLDVGGTLQVTQQPPPAKNICTTVHGHAGLYGAAKRALIGIQDASITVSSSELRVQILMQLGANCTLGGGWIIGRQGVAITGRLRWTYGPGNNVLDVPDATARFMRSGIALEVAARIFGNECHLIVEIPWLSGELAARVRFTMGPSVQSLVNDALGSIGDAVAGEVDKLRAQLGNYVHQWNVEISLRGFRAVALAFCSLSDEVIQSSVDAAIDSFIHAHHIPNPFGAASRIAKATVHGRLAQVNAQRRQLRAALQNRDPVHTRAALKSALGAIPSYQRLEMGIGPLKFVHDFFSPQQLAMIGNALQAVDSLPAISSHKQNAQKLVDAALDRKNVVDAVRRNVDQAPRVDHFDVRTELGPLSRSNVGAEAQVSYGGKSYTVAVTVDLGNLPASVSSVVRSFIAQL